MRDVAVLGAGNIGTTLANLLLDRRETLGIRRVLVLKGQPEPWLEADLALLHGRGAETLLATTPEERGRLLAEVSYAFDCRQAGAPMADRPRYEAIENLVGVVAQGTEEGFGVPIVSGTNGHLADGERFVQVTSCNTHATTTLVRALVGSRSEHLVEADFVIVRRSEDIGSSGRLVGSNVVARHRDPSLGTHHAVDALRVFSTIGVSPKLTSSDVTTPSQTMHALRFTMRFDVPVDPAELVARLEADPWLACTSKFDSNRVFELGRRYGFQGRIYAHAIVVANDLLVSDDTVRGWAFVPQEGNTILSTVEAFLRQTRQPDPPEIMARLAGQLVLPRW